MFFRSSLLNQIIVAVAICAAAAGQDRAEPPQLTLDAWKEACSALPSNQSILNRKAVSGTTAITNEQFQRLLDQFFAVVLSGSMANEKLWVGGKPAENFYSAEPAGKIGRSMEFFAQKLRLPTGSKVVFHGDLHGDIRSLLVTLTSLEKRGILNGFKLADPKTHLVFLGDYTDRGNYGVEVLATLLQLKISNPDQVWLSRGNHEEFRMVAEYGFLAEVQKKFGPKTDFRKIVRVFECLPAVIYVGSEGGDYLQCNHGGMEPGFSPVALLEAPAAVAWQRIDMLKRASFVRKHPDLLQGVAQPERSQLQTMLRDTIPQGTQSFGYLWNDFSVFSDEPSLSYRDGRGWIYGKSGTAVVLGAHSTSKVRVRAVFRAHQHSRQISPLMQRLLVSQGIFQHWQPSDAAGLATASPALLKRLVDTSATRSVQPDAVYTFNVSPDSVYGIGCYYNFVTHGILSVAEKFESWKLEVVAQAVSSE